MRCSRRCIQLVVLATALSLFLVPAAQASGPRSRAERAFLTEMVSHHAMAVDMAKMVAN